MSAAVPAIRFFYGTTPVSHRAPSGAVHRAIAVCNELVMSGVNNDRIQVAGWGEYRPLIPNETGGTAVNRRVEIYLTAAGDRETMTMTEDTMTTSVPVDTDEPMK